MNKNKKLLPKRKAHLKKRNSARIIEMIEVIEMIRRLLRRKLKNWDLISKEAGLQDSKMIGKRKRIRKRKK